MREIDPAGKRRAILDAALELFEQRGFYGTTVPAIAARAKVGAGTVYRNFESKAELVNVLYREAKLRLAQHLLAEVPKGVSTRELLRHLWWRMVAYAREEEASLAFTEIHHHAEYLDEQSRAVSQGAHARFIELLEREQARGTIKGINPEVILATVEGVFFVMFRRARSCGIGLSDEDLRAAEQCVWEAIRA